jgi:hypothetical protein
VSRAALPIACSPELSLWELTDTDTSTYTMTRISEINTSTAQTFNSDKLVDLVNRNQNKICSRHKFRRAQNLYLQALWLLSSHKLFAATFAHFVNGTSATNFVTGTSIQTL